MESHSDVIVKVPPSMGEMLGAFMRAAGVTTVSGLTRKAVDYALSQKDYPPLAPEKCEVFDDFYKRKTGQEITIGLVFKGEAAVLSERMDLLADESWVTEGIYDYMNALTPALPREDLQAMFARGVGGDRKSQLYPH